jgi:aminoglycoside phosphotransferase
MALSRNHCQSGTSAGQVECANKLIRLALVMAGQGQTEAADELARRAWLHLRRIPPDTEPGVRANAEELAGLLYERLAGDTASAQRSYQNALKACPVSTWAREALDRMNRAAEINAKNQGRSPIGD